MFEIIYYKEKTLHPCKLLLKYHKEHIPTHSVTARAHYHHPVQGGKHVKYLRLYSKMIIHLSRKFCLDGISHSQTTRDK